MKKIIDYLISLVILFPAFLMLAQANVPMLGYLVEWTPRVFNRNPMNMILTFSILLIVLIILKYIFASSSVNTNIIKGKYPVILTSFVISLIVTVSTLLFIFWDFIEIF